ncbi:unnamed protein product [Acanthoscelides obtectus]|uniref:Uncharacterized protein n=1 Tax=Acanthoscelides obtectus TaxID=200917 RepID=A0A9P0JRL5_ACAOB|nr:unnamed protein product [Acanthoscelides obtectus]CAK1668002.1 hypothetical protein AOBTE_LOCUS26176 [Acanthoscelides obtectus]
MLLNIEKIPSTLRRKKQCLLSMILPFSELPVLRYDDHQSFRSQYIIKINSICLFGKFYFVILVKEIQTYF